MQINQPFELGLGIFLLVVGVAVFWGGLYRVRNPSPPTRGWWSLAFGPMLWFMGLARISNAFDSPGHPSARTLHADLAALVVALVVLALIFPGARAVWQTSRQGRDKPAV